MDGHISSSTTTNRDLSMKSVFTKKWALDFNSKIRSTATSELHPPGYVDRSFPANVVKDSDRQLVVQRGWSIALGPIRQIPMNLFIMWISGNSISIFPLMSVLMCFIRPVQALFSLQSTFDMIEGSQAPIQCLVYVLGNSITILLAMYKCHTMGLFPTYSSDWLAFVEQPLSAELSAGGLAI